MLGGAQEPEFVAWGAVDGETNVLIRRADSTAKRTFTCARWAFSWKVVNGRANAGARFAIKGLQGPD